MKIFLIIFVVLAIIIAILRGPYLYSVAKDSIRNITSSIKSTPECKPYADQFNQAVEDKKDFNPIVKKAELNGCKK